MYMTEVYCAWYNVESISLSVRVACLVAVSCAPICTEPPFSRSPAVAVVSYEIIFSLAAPGASGEFQLVADGDGCDNYDSDLSGIVSVESTGSWGVFENVTV